MRTPYGPFGRLGRQTACEVLDRDDVIPRNTHRTRQRGSTSESGINTTGVLAYYLVRHVLFFLFFPPSSVERRTGNGEVIVECCHDISQNALACWWSGQLQGVWNGVIGIHQGGEASTYGLQQRGHLMQVLMGMWFRLSLGVPCTYTVPQVAIKPELHVCMVMVIVHFIIPPAPEE